MKSWRASRPPGGWRPRFVDGGDPGNVVPGVFFSLIRFTLAALDPKALEQCKQAWFEAVNQLPEEGRRLLLNSARRAGFLD